VQIACLAPAGTDTLPSLPDKAREDESTGFVVWASIVGGTMMVASLLMLVIAFHRKYTDDPGIVSGCPSSQIVPYWLVLRN
jgi:hypothetical protein